MVCRARAVTPMEIRAQAGGGVGLLLDVFGLGSLLPQAAALVKPGGSYVETETLVSEASDAERPAQ